MVVEKAGHGLNLQSKPTLGYWNIRGLAAPIRYLLHICGVEFEDKVYGFGPAPDFSRDEWLNEKFTLGLDLPNLPYLIDEGVKLTETVAIMKYIAHKWMPDFIGRNPIELGNVEMMFKHVYDLKINSTMPCYMSADREALKFDEEFDRCAKWMETRDWISGGEVTYLDFFYWETLEWIDYLWENKLDEKYPALAAYRKRFASMPGFAEIFADDSKSMKFPFNGDMAHIGSRSSA